MLGLACGLLVACSDDGIEADRRDAGVRDVDGGVVAPRDGGAEDGVVPADAGAADEQDGAVPADAGAAEAEAGMEPVADSGSGEKDSGAQPDGGGDTTDSGSRTDGGASLPPAITDLCAEPWGWSATALGPGPSPLQQGTYVPLDFAPLDIEYAPALDRFVAVSSTPAALRVFGPSGVSELTVMLDAFPDALTVAPSGARAAVGHRDHISLVDLSSGDVTMIAFARGVAELADPGGAWLYVVPASSGSTASTSVSSVEIATGMAVDDRSWGGSNLGVMALGPDRDQLYVAIQTTAGEVARFDLSAGPARLVRSSAVPPRAACAAPLTVSRAGDQLLTGCGSAIHLSDDPALDLTYDTSLAPRNTVASATHAPGRAQYAVLFKALVASSEADPDRIRTQVHIYSDAYLEHFRTAALPDYEEAGAKAPLLGRFIAYSADEQALFVIAETSSSSTLPRRQAIVTLPGELAAGPEPPAIDDGGPYHLLQASLIAAEYSRSLERIALITRSPSRLSVLDPATHAQADLELPRTPLALSLSPTGRHAVVVFDGWLSYYQLEPLELLRTLPLAARPGDVAIDEDELVYAEVPDTDHVLRADLRTGSAAMLPEPLSTRLGRYVPEDRAFYVAGASDGLVRMELVDGAIGPEVRSDSLDYALCSQWWPGDDGRMYGACGHVFTRAVDALYRGTLGGFELETYGSDASFIHIAQSAAAELVASIRKTATVSGIFAGDSREVLLHEDAYLTARGRVRLPAFSVNGMPLPAHPRFAFFSPDGTRLDVLAQAASYAGVLRDSGLISADLTGLAPCPPEPQDEPLPVTGGQQGAASLVPLPFDVIDAAFSRELGRIVIVSSDPPRLRLLDPATTAVDSVVDLPLAPTRVVLEAGGLSALIGHHGWLSRVSLAPPALSEVHALSTTAHDIAIANGRAYVVPERDQSTRLRAIDLATGEETRAANIRAGIGLRTAPDGLSLLMTYPSRSGTDDLRRISVADADTPPQDVFGIETRDVLVTADVGDAIWMASDGARLFGSGAGVFDLSDPQAASYAKIGALEGITGVAALDHSSSRGRIAVVPRAADPQLQTLIDLFDDASYARLSRAALPSFSVPGRTIQSRGLFVFFSNDGVEVYVLVEAMASSPLSARFGLVRMPVSL